MTPRRSMAGALLLIFGLALLLRLLSLYQLAGTPVFAFLVGDAQSYDRWAQRLAAGDWIGSEVFYQAPGYAYFLGGLYTLLGHDILAVRVVQAVLGSFSCVFLALAGYAFFGRRSGILAGLLLACWPAAIYFDLIIQKSVLDMLLMALLLWMLGRCSASRWSLTPPLWAGLALAALVLTRENALAFIPLILLYLAMLPARPRGEPPSLAARLKQQHDREHGGHTKPPPRQRLWSRVPLRVTACILGLALLLVPVAVRNYHISGEIHLTTSQFGPNFYIGNGPQADGLYKPLRFGRGHPFYERQDATAIASEELGRQLTPGEVSQYWTEQALAHIRHKPAAWATLMARKAILVWHQLEVPDSEDIYTAGDWSLILRVLQPVLNFGTLMPVAVLGLCMTAGRYRRLWVLYLMLLGYAASVVAFYIMARYRLPLLPILILFAAVALARFRAWWATTGTLGAVGRRYVALAMAATAAIVATWPLAWLPTAGGMTPVSKDTLVAASYNNIGVGLFNQGKDPVEAIGYYRRALERAPRYPQAHNNMGVALAALDQHADAVVAYQQAIRRKRAYPSAWYNLGVSLMRLGQSRQAADAFAESLKYAPGDVAARVNLGSALAALGKADEARSAYRDALRLDPRSAAAHNNLGTLLARQGDLASAEVHFADAVALDPDNADARFNLGRALAARGQTEQALDHWSVALELAPGPDLAMKVSDAQLKLGRLEDAAATLRQARQASPDNPALAARLAWLLATAGPPKAAPEAVQLAEAAHAMRGGRDAHVMDVLAAAYAALGRFDAAISTATQALAMARQAGQAQQAAMIEAHLEMYRQGKPLRVQP